MQQMERRNRSPRAMRLVPRARNNQGWPAVAFHYSRSCDANYTAVPAFAIQDHAIGFAQRGLCFQPVLDAVHDAPFFLLTLGIQLVKPGGHLPRTLHVFLIEQVHHVASNIHTAGGVQSWSDAESEFG